MANQGVDIGSACSPPLIGQVLHRRLKPVCQLAQPHGAGQARAALERVQAAHAGRRRLRIGGFAGPGAQLGLQPRQQVLHLFGEDGQQVGIDGIGLVEVFLEATQPVVADRL